MVAACTPKTHEPLFQETLINAGLNKYLFEMANIRNQDSWVHKNNPDLATEKAKDLVRMAVSKVALMEPLEEAELTRQPDRHGHRRRHLRHDRGPEPCRARDMKPISWRKATELGGQALNLYQTGQGETIGPRAGRPDRQPCKRTKTSRSI